MFQPLLSFTFSFLFIAISLAQSSVNFQFNDVPYLYEIKTDEQNQDKAYFTISSEVSTDYNYLWINLHDSLNIDSQKVYIQHGEFYISKNSGGTDTLDLTSVSADDTVKSFYNGELLVYEHKTLADSFKINKVTRLEKPKNNAFKSLFSFDENISEEDFRYLFANAFNKSLPDTAKIDDLIKDKDLLKSYNDLIFRLWYYSKDYFAKKEFTDNIKAIENEKLVEAGVLILKTEKFELDVNNENGNDEKEENPTASLNETDSLQGINKEQGQNKPNKKNKNEDPVFFQVEELEVEIKKNQTSITVHGNIFIKNKPQAVIVEFNQWDFYLNNTGFSNQTNSFEIDGVEYGFNVGQFLKYVGPADAKASINVKNTTFKLTQKDNKEVLYKRAFTDFISGVLFTDLLSSRAQKPNKFLQTEIMVNIPLSHSNTKRTIWVNELVGAVTYSQIADDVPQLDLVKGNDTIYRAPFIDFIKYNSIQTRFRLNIVRFQNKKIQGNHYFDLGFDMFTTSVRYFKGIEKIGQDSTANYSTFLVNKISPQATYRFEAFPTNKVGLFFDVGYGLFFKQRTNTKDGIDYRISPTDRIEYQEDGSEKMIDTRVAHLLTYSINAMYLFNPEKGAAGGIFARIRLYQDVHAEEFYPQLLIGYGVNISSLMK